ncbi:MAG: c-type cytochrome [Proteobacteria bacterium]|nr:c-type cytochrome [Pseudomonadota bacterium]
MHPQFAKMFGGKQFLEGISVVETGLDKDLTGEELIRKNGCNGCHAIRGFSEANEMVGPSLLNLAARLNREQIRQSIVNPEGVLVAVNVLTKKPYASGVMPRSFAVDLSESELDRMIDYLMVK